MTAELAAAAAVASVIAAPHAMPLHRVRPMLAATAWLLALGVRALVAIGSALFFLVYLPQTELFGAVAAWCWHQVLPLLAAHLGLSGHPLAHLAGVLPALALAASLIWLLVGSGRAWLAVRRQLRRSLGEGPWGSTLVPDRRVVVALTGFGRGRVLLSPAALGALDGEELRASVEHELGHLRRRHRPLLGLGSVLASLGKPLPGTRAARRELIFSLERDADQYAVSRTRDPLALASAICKAGSSQLAAALPLGGSGRLGDRLDVLVEGPRMRRRGVEHAAVGLAAVLAATLLALAAALPAWALSGAATAAASAPGACPH